MLLLLAPLLGLVGVVAAELVPDGRIGYHVLRAQRAGLIDTGEHTPSPLGTTTDHFSECVAITIGLGDRPGDSVVTSALRSPSYVGCEQAAEHLEELDRTDALPAGRSYLRYWHGYAVVSRPALGVFGLAGARWVGFAVLVVAVAGMVASVARRFGPAPAAVLVAPALLTTDMVLGGLVLPHALGLATAWFGGWLTLTLVRRAPAWRTAALAAGVAGALSAYADLMTTMPGALALAVTGAALGVRAGARPPAGPGWRVPVGAAVGWVAGLAWMWASKWVLAATVVGVDAVVDNVRTQIEFRLAGEHGDVEPTPLRGLADVLETWWHEPLTPWVLLGLVAMISWVLARWRPSRTTWWTLGPVWLAVVVPVAGWFAALNNHTQIHAWIVYRSLPIAAGALAAVTWIAVASRVLSERSVPDRA